MKGDKKSVQKLFICIFLYLELNYWLYKWSIYPSLRATSDFYSSKVASDVIIE